MIKKNVFFLSILLTLNGCKMLENNKTNHPTNACHMLKENEDWLESIHRSSQRWDVPASVILSIIKVESSFVYDAKPIKEKGFFWDTYHSSAYGFSQALDGTWNDYKIQTLNASAKRTSFSDSSDFIGWYINNINKATNIKRHDTYNIYLAYHEGIGGYKRKTYKKKRWLIKKAKYIKNLTLTYSKQIKYCNF